MKYSGTYICGHQGYVNVIGPHKEREWKINRAFSHLCPECEKAQYEAKIIEDNNAAAKKSKEMELPALTGSEKQITWATTIRVKFVESFYKFIEDGKTFYYKDKRKISEEDLRLAFDMFIETQTKASAWIDKRTNSVDQNLEMIYDAFLNEKKAQKQLEIIKELEEESIEFTVKPENSCKSGSVILMNFDKEVTAKYTKDESFIKIVKRQRFRWNGSVWKHKIDEFSGSADDRIASLGNALLANGFTVQFPNEKTKNLAVCGTFEKECVNWIMFDTTAKKLAISWEGHNDSFYQKSKLLPSAKWKDGSMLVPVEFYREVEEFSQIMKFKISNSAKEAIERYKKTEERYERKNVKEVTDTENDYETKLRNVLKKEGVIEDLVDN